jgi:glycogen synthase kinase 3 beta
LHAFYTTGEKQDEIYLNLVLNYVPDNLNRMIRNFTKNKEEFPIFLAKLYAFQMARALAFMHSQGVLHRDIKPQNILIDPSTNRVYICDFGSAKKFNGEEQNVAYICSRYYRAPELIFGNTDYDSSIDIWSFGCVIAEMFLGKPIFQGETTVDQLLQIIKILGTPDSDQLSCLNKNNTMNYQFPTVKPYTISKILNGKPKELINLLQKIFIYEPHKRLSALEIMVHPFFDDLRNSELAQNGKFIVPQIFDFTENEINLCKNKNLLKKILPDWSESYRNIFNINSE